MAWVFEIALFLLMMVFCRPGDAVNCYLCSTQDDENQCLYPRSSNLVLTKCDQRALDRTRDFAKKIDHQYDQIFQVDNLGYAAINTDLSCLKVITKFGNKKITFRGCQLGGRPSQDICVEIGKADKDHLLKQHCSRCYEDGCNSAPKLLSPAMYPLLIVAVSVTVVVYKSF